MHMKGKNSKMLSDLNCTIKRKERHNHGSMLPQNHLPGFRQRGKLLEMPGKPPPIQNSCARNVSSPSRAVSKGNGTRLESQWICRSVKKTELPLRRIRLSRSRKVYQIRPSFMMPYMIGSTSEVSKGLYMYHAGASFEAVAFNHGHNAMYWWRAMTSLGRNSLVGTTVKAQDKMPENLLADEKHTFWYKDRVYLATTVGEGCILGASLARGASEEELTPAYAEFMVEAQELKPDYQPVSVNTDGWTATQNAWENLSDKVCLVLCFLHAALKIRDRSRREKLKKELMSKVWGCYHAFNRASFAQQIRRLREWTEDADLTESVKDKVFSLCEHSPEFKMAFELPKAHRTSNMLDRLMDYQDRMLYKARYLHSAWIEETGRLFVRAMALLWNFHPFGKKTGRHSPFADLNGFVYHSNWLENMMIAASMGGRR